MEFQCRVIVQRRFASYCKSVENIPLQAERHSARRQETVRLPIGIGVHLQTGMLFGITTESCSASERNRVHWLPRIGSWKHGDPAPRHIPELPQWAKARALDAVIWTALRPRFEGENRTPSVDEVITYLGGLMGTVRDYARQYVERTPRQIDTGYRRQIEATLGWSCKADS